MRFASCHSSCAWLLLLTWSPGIIGCGSQVEPEVVIWATVDQEIAAPVLAAFHRAEEKQIRPLASFVTGRTDDTIETLCDEQPDLVWTDDPFLMIDLQQQNMLASHAWKIDPGFPAELRASDQTWCGFAAMARVLIVNTELLTDASEFPQSIDDLVDERWAKRCAMAKPTTGNAAIHAAIIANMLGDAAVPWFQRAAANCVVLASDAAVAKAVAEGRVDWGLTDSTVAIARRDAGQPIAIIFPDQATSEPGTVRIPQVVAVLAGARNRVSASRLADYLVLPTTEDRFAMGDPALIPLSRLAMFKPRVLPDLPVRWTQSGFAAAHRTWTTQRGPIQKMFE